MIFFNFHRMIKHIVFWKMKSEAEGRTAQENASIMVAKLNSLKSLVPQVVEIDAGVDFNRSEAAWDVALYSTFKTRADLDAYQVHPEHLKVVEFVRAVVAARSVVDYEI